MVKKDLIAERYKNDGVPLLPLNDIQRKLIAELTADTRVRYDRIESCPLCEGKSFTLIAEKDRFGIPLETGVCDRCGFIFSLQQMVPESSHIFYSEYYRHIDEGVACPTKEHYEKKYQAQKHARIPKFLKRDDIVVEIGTGGGWNLIRFQKEGFHHYGFDYDERFIAFGKEAYGLNLFLGGLPEARTHGVKANYLFLPHVLEHTARPVEFLVGLKDIMVEGAILNVSLPSASLLIVGGSVVGHDLLSTLQLAHNFLFDELTLRYTTLKSGYVILAVLGENIVLRKVEKKSRENLRAFVSINDRLQHHHRGAKVIRYLKMCEKLIPFKNKLRRIVGERFISSLPYAYYLSKPIDVGRKYLLYRLGIMA